MKVFMDLLTYLQFLFLFPLVTKFMTSSVLVRYLLKSWIAMLFNSQQWEVLYIPVTFSCYCFSSLEILSEGICFLWTVINNQQQFPANIYLLKVNNIYTRRRCEIFSTSTIKTLEWCHWRCSGVFIVNFEHISHHSLVFLLLSFNK